MNEWINAWPSAVPPLPSVPVPCILSKCFKPDWEVKGTEEEWGEPQMQLAASPLPGGHSSLTFLPKARRSLSVEVKGLWASISSPRSLWLSPMSHGKAKATQGWWGRSIAAEGEDRGHLSYLVSPHRGSPPWRCCFQQPCVFAEAVFNFLFLWAKWWIELASRSVPTWVVVLSTWLLAASLGARRAQYTLRHIIHEAWPQAVSEVFQLLWLLLFLPILDSSIWISWLRSWAVTLSLCFDPNSSLFIFLFNRILVSIRHISCFLWNILFSFLHVYIFYLSLLYWYFPHFSSLIFCLIVCNSVICIAFFFPLFSFYCETYCREHTSCFSAQSLLKQPTALQGMWWGTVPLHVPVPLPLPFHLNHGSEFLKDWSGTADPNSVHLVLKTKTKFHSGM